MPWAWRNAQKYDCIHPSKDRRTDELICSGAVGRNLVK